MYPNIAAAAMINNTIPVVDPEPTNAFFSSFGFNSRYIKIPTISPYVQYTYARCASVFRKVGAVELPAEIDYSVLTDDATMNLLKDLTRFPEVIKEAADKYEPFMIARFAVSVAQHFNKFYHDCQINVEEENVKLARLKVVDVTMKVIKSALDLLGIECPEQM